MTFERFVSTFEFNVGTTALSSVNVVVCTVPAYLATLWVTKQFVQYRGAAFDLKPVPQLTWGRSPSSYCCIFRSTFFLSFFLSFCSWWCITTFFYHSPAACSSSCWEPSWPLPSTHPGSAVEWRSTAVAVSCILDSFARVPVLFSLFTLFCDPTGLFTKGKLQFFFYGSEPSCEAISYACGSIPALPSL